MSLTLFITAPAAVEDAAGIGAVTPSVEAADAPVVDVVACFPVPFPLASLLLPVASLLLAFPFAA